jgi:hypothetical protein
MTLEALHYSDIWSNIGKATLQRNIDVTIGWAACEASSVAWNLGIKSAFALGSRETTENLDRVSAFFPELCVSLFFFSRTEQRLPKSIVKFIPLPYQYVR